jgi:MoaA/NifB/PqqE/SkfB family radical SAM enzyme
MSPAVFEQALARSVEYRALLREEVDGDLALVNLCGLGEPLLNKHVAGFAARVREEGFRCQMSSNGALLDERRGRELLDAGLQSIWINVGERDEDYEEIYKLPFEKTRDNVLAFNEMAAGRCEVHIVLVDHRRDAAHIESMREYWSGLGLTQFMQYEVMNRGGALFVDHMQYEEYPEQVTAREMIDATEAEVFCGAPFAFLFVGYDGQYYLCCSDWKKEVPLGSVFDWTFHDTLRGRFEHVIERRTICQSCNHDPLNRLTDQLRAEAAGEAGPGAAEAKLAEEVGYSRDIAEMLRRLEPRIGEAAPARRLIPVVGR